MTVSHKQQGYIEQRTKTDENIDNSCGYAARLECPCYNIKIKDTDNSPSDTTDDGKYEGYFLYN